MGMSSPAARGRASTTPTTQSLPPTDLIHSPTSNRLLINRDRHAVPPSILAQNRELLGIAERPRLLTCNQDQQAREEPVHTPSAEGGHIEYSEGFMSTITIPKPRRRSTLTTLGEAARRTGRDAKRRLSKVIPWKRRDSGTESETTSPRKRVHRMVLRNGSEKTESRATLLSDGQVDSGTAWEEDTAIGTSSYTFAKTHQPPGNIPGPLQLDLSNVQRIAANPSDWQASPQTLMRLSLEYHNELAIASPDLCPHENFMEDQELWEGSRRRLELLARRPELVGERFERIHRELL